MRNKTSISTDSTKKRTKFIEEKFSLKQLTNNDGNLHSMRETSDGTKYRVFFCVNRSFDDQAQSEKCFPFFFESNKANFTEKSFTFSDDEHARKTVISHLVPDVRIVDKKTNEPKIKERTNDMPVVAQLIKKPTGHQFDDDNLSDSLTSIDQTISKPKRASPIPISKP